MECMKSRKYRILWEKDPIMIKNWIVRFKYEH